MPLSTTSRDIYLPLREHPNIRNTRDTASLKLFSP